MAGAATSSNLIAQNYWPAFPVELLQVANMPGFKPHDCSQPKAKRQPNAKRTTSRLTLYIKAFRTIVFQAPTMSYSKPFCGSDNACKGDAADLHSKQHLMTFLFMLLQIRFNVNLRIQAADEALQQLQSHNFYMHAGLKAIW